MAAHKNNDRQASENRERLRLFQGRQRVHEHEVARRKRDNLLAVGIAVLAVAVAVTALALSGGGSPGAQPSATPSASASVGQGTGPVPSPDLSEHRTWTGSMGIDAAQLGIELDGAAAPQAVASFVTLAQDGFFDGLTCHRLVDQPGAPGFHVLQCGDPEGNGSGGPGYAFGPIENAPSDNFYSEGVIAMARQGNNAASNGSQFFILFGDTTIPADSAGGYSVFGRVTSGMDALKAEVTDLGIKAGTQSTPEAPAVIGSVTVE